MVDMTVRMGNHVNARKMLSKSFRDVGAIELPAFSSHNDFTYNGMRVAVRSAVQSSTYSNRAWSYRNEKSDDTDIFVLVGLKTNGDLDHICVIPYHMLKYNSHLEVYSSKQYTYAPYVCGIGDVIQKIDSMIDEWDDILTYSDRHRN